MRVAIDADCLPAGGEEHFPLTEYVFALVRTLPAIAERVMLITRSENHARFEPLRDERTDIVLVRRPLFEGREVSDWAALLGSHPKAGADILAAHQQEKLRLMEQLGAQVLHFAADAHELMEIDVPIVLSVHEPNLDRLSAELADALVVHDRARASLLPHGKAFVVPIVSTVFPRQADEDSEECPSAALAEAYEHALASFELRKAA